MNTASVQCITVEVLPSQVIEVDCEVRAIPAGDLATLENIRLSAQASANRARGHATSAQLYSMESGASASSAHESRMNADVSADRALTSSLDSGKNADLAKSSADRAQQSFGDCIRQVELSTNQADRAETEAIKARNQATLAGQIKAETDAIKNQTQTIHDTTQTLANEALTELDSTTQTIRDEMVQLEVNVNATTAQAVESITAQFIPLATAIIETQTIVTEHHAFR